MILPFKPLIKLFLILLVFWNHDALAIEEPHHLDAINAFKTIVIEGPDIPKVLGQPLDTFSLAAVIDDEQVIDQPERFSGQLPDISIFTPQKTLW